MKTLLISLLLATPVLANDEAKLDEINGYWTVNKWGEHQLCVFIAPTVSQATIFKCFPVPKKVGKQIPA